MPDPIEFRHVMGHFATGVTVVTSRRPDGVPCGLTATAFSSVSLDPLLVLVCLDRDSATHRCIEEAGAFGVCILPDDASEVARRFSEGSREDRFEGLELLEAVTGSPLLRDGLAWLDCEVRDVHRAGDHSIVVGEVLACDAREGRPLLFFRGDYEGVGP